jgi:methyl-accepting chemotaxis protein
MRLSEQSGQIAEISGLVADISNQTNMLALNAAVEAARAGEQGKGFSVVSTEIRKLADESKQSAEKINLLIQNLQASMNSTVMVTDEGAKKTAYNIELAQRTAQAFNNVTEAINNVFVNSQQISLSAKQQAVAVQQVMGAMNAINLGAQETSAGINQVRVSTEQLNGAAKNLQAVV